MFKRRLKESVVAKVVSDPQGLLERDDEPEKDEPPKTWNRQLAKVWFETSAYDPGYSQTKTKREALVPYDDPSANLITSQIEGSDWHAPVIDLDFPCELRPSATEGHFHLLLNKPVTWEKYQLLLKALVAAGLCEHGWVQSAINSGMSAIRAEGVIKYEMELYRKNLSSLVEDLEKVDD